MSFYDLSGCYRGPSESTSHIPAQSGCASTPCVPNPRANRELVGKSIRDQGEPPLGAIFDSREIAPVVRICQLYSEALGQPNEPFSGRIGDAVHAIINFWDGLNADDRAEAIVFAQKLDAAGFTHHYFAILRAGLGMDTIVNEHGITQLVWKNETSPGVIWRTPVEGV